MSLAKLQDTKSGYGINLFLYKSNEQSENEVNTDTVAPEKLFGDKFHKRYIEPNCWKTQVLEVQSHRGFVTCGSQNTPSL